MKRIHLLVVLFVFGFVGLAIAAAPQAPDAPKDKAAACHKKDAAACCKMEGDVATSQKDAKACPMIQKNADGAATAKDGCFDPGIAGCKDGKCCAAHEAEKPAKDAAAAVTVSDDATAAGDSCCGSGAACCTAGAKCCAKAA